MRTTTYRVVQSVNYQISCATQVTRDNLRVGLRTFTGKVSFFGVCGDRGGARFVRKPPSSGRGLPSFLGKPFSQAFSKR